MIHLLIVFNSLLTVLKSDDKKIRQVIPKLGRLIPPRIESKACCVDFATSLMISINCECLQTPIREKIPSIHLLLLYRVGMDCNHAYFKL